MAQARYQVKVFDPTDGRPRGIITDTDFASLAYEKWVNQSHNYQLVLNGSHRAIDWFVLDAIVEIWRKPEGRDWYLELGAFHRSPSPAMYENGNETFTSYGRGYNDLLRRRSVLYFTNTAYTLKEGHADDVMKEIVYENVGSGASSTDRLSDWVAATSGFTVAPDTGVGPNWRGAFAYKNVHDQLLDIAVTAGVDFEVIRTGPTGRTGEVTFEFRTYYPQRGSDLRNTVIFEPSRANMARVIATESRTEEVNAVLILGSGEESSRRTWAQSTGATVDSPWNVIELAKDSRNAPDLASMQEEATKELTELAARTTFELTVLQTLADGYGVRFNVGDIVTGTYKGISSAKKIIKAAVTVSDGKENINPEFADVIA